MVPTPGNGVRDAAGQRWREQGWIKLSQGAHRPGRSKNGFPASQGDKGKLQCEWPCV